MPNLLNAQWFLVLTGLLLLLSPAVVGAVTLWIKSVVQPKKTDDGQVATVVKLLELKNRLEREGCTVAASTTKDLVYAVVYGEKPPKE